MCRRARRLFHRLIDRLQQDRLLNRLGYVRVASGVETLARIFLEGGRAVRGPQVSLSTDWPSRFVHAYDLGLRIRSGISTVIFLVAAATPREVAPGLP